MKISIPHVPVAKGRPRLSRWGTYTPKKTKDYMEFVQEILRQHCREPISRPVELRLTFIMPIPKSTSKKMAERLLDTPHIKRPDGDNLEKMILDSCNGILFNDDSQIWKCTWEKIYGTEPMTIIEV